jgi:hypothetical protein
VTIGVRAAGETREAGRQLEFELSTGMSLYADFLNLILAGAAASRIDPQTSGSASWEFGEQLQVRAVEEDGIVGDER